MKKQVLILIFIIASLFTAIYIIFMKRKKSPIKILHTAVIFSFAVYLQFAYSFIIFPFPENSISISGKDWLGYFQLKPFNFFNRMINSYKFFGSWGKVMKVEYDAFLNILLTIPFGLYLCCFKKNLKQTIIATFCLSLFFEVSQITALFFIFTSPYRSFDIDDLIMNTLGGLCGYGLYILFLKSQVRLKTTLRHSDNVRKK